MASPGLSHSSALNRRAPTPRRQVPSQATQHLYKIPATNTYHRSYKEKIVIGEKTDSRRAHSRKIEDCNTIQPQAAGFKVFWGEIKASEVSRPSVFKY